MKEQIREIFAEVFEINIDDDFSINTTDKWDSLAHLDIIVGVENKFNISLSPQEMGAIKSFNDVVEIVKNKFDL